ncbi:asparagine synthase (glutamine-hydrolyzing) [Lysobacter sp. K5869]|nr:asparagine synthase (glutamine-hydrolyzing) [Lysobacter sp. K5869]QWP75969.1 asparagine synthase (glutamine-hydrolyzing) [Lysobacter sp. K5869]
MSGLAGVWRAQPDWEDERLRYCLRSMIHALQHRGAYAHEVWSDAAAGVAMAHCRERQGAAQPVASADGRYLLSMDGALYERDSLHRALVALNAVGPQASDAELMLGAIVRWGLRRALARCDGAFALSLWDRQERQLWLARDRVGERPLYYGWVDGDFAYASELKALHRLPGFDAPVDRDALSLLLRYDYIPAPYSIHCGVFKLAPGTLLRMSFAALRAGASGHHPERDAQTYWCPRQRMAEAVELRGDIGADEAVDQLEILLQQAVTARMRAPVAVGAFLSGGTDSSLVTAMMQAQSSTPVDTYAIGFDDDRHDESDWARAVARALGTRHTEHRVGGREALEAIDRLPDVWCEPFADSSQVPTLIASELVARRSPIALTGDGGDELFFGHSAYCRAVRNARWNERVPASLRRLAPRRSGGEAERARLGGVRALWAELGAQRVEDHYLQRVSRWRDPAAAVPGACEPATLFRDRDGHLPVGDAADRVQYLDFRMDLPNGILTKIDRAGSACGLETRSPLLDRSVIEFAWSLPTALKHHRGEQKYVLKRLLERYLPNKLIYRPKTGFGAPVSRWLRGPLREWAEALLDESRLRREGHFDPRAIRTVWNEFQAGERKWHTHLWNVLMFQAWLERHRFAAAPAPAALAIAAEIAPSAPAALPRRLGVLEGAAG